MALEGTLHDTSLVDLFEIFRMGNKSGILRMFSSNQHSTIHVTMGRLIDAAVYDAITQQLVSIGDDAVLQMLKWEIAEFSFTHDPSTVRHPVTIFLALEQLICLSAEVHTPVPQAVPTPHMAMPIAANLAFIADLDPMAYAADQQISRHYRRLSTFTTAYATRMPAQPYATPESESNPVMFAGVTQREAPAKLDPSALDNHATDREYATAPVLQPIQAPRALVSSAGRKLLAAVLRRVREI